MLSVNELRNGTFYQEQGQIYLVLSFEHIKMGRGSANIKVKVQNVRTGSITDKSFINNAKVEEVRIVKKPLQFLYKDSNDGHFMDPTTFEQLSVPLKKLLDHKYLKEGENFTVSFFEDEPLSLLLPPKMELKVSDTGPSLRGNSATNIYKDAILENGIATKVPLFIKTGDKVRIDTRSGTYTKKV